MSRLFFLFLIIQILLLTNALPTPSSLPPFTTNAPHYYPPNRLSELAIYFGQNTLLPNESLSKHCANPNIDIIVLGFVSSYFSTSDPPSSTNLPTLNLGSYCGNPHPSAFNLLSCPSMGTEIAACQAKGKKILLSLGGQHGRPQRLNSASAEILADNLWNLFGGGTAFPEKRPFGSAEVDGFDLDPESHDPTGYTALIARLRTHYAAAASKHTRYISAAPQCYRPESSLGDAVYGVDYLFVQMYNNPSCEASSANIVSSITEWSEDVWGHNPNVKIFPGFLGAPEAGGEGGSGWVDVSRVAGVVAEVRGLRNIAGVMVWDGSYGTKTVEGGRTFLEGVKEALMA